MDRVAPSDVCPQVFDPGQIPSGQVSHHVAGVFRKLHLVENEAGVDDDDGVMSQIVEGGVDWVADTLALVEPDHGRGRSLGHGVCGPPKFLGTLVLDGKIRGHGEVVREQMLQGIEGSPKLRLKHVDRHCVGCVGLKVPVISI